MRFFEIFQLTERISLTQHQDKVLRAMSEGVLKTMYEMNDDLGSYEFSSLHDVDPSTYEGSVSAILYPILKGYFEIHLKRNLEDTLSTVSRNIVGVGSPGRWVNVVFKNTRKNRGWAEEDNTVGLSKTHYLDNLIIQIIENIYNIIDDNHESGENIPQTLGRFIKKLPNDNRLQAVLIVGGRRGDTKLLNELAGTVLHELTHVQQHMVQHKKGRDSTQYRSYLQKSKQQFHKAYNDETTPEWYKLHASSPQEIGAHVNDIALNIINDFDLSGAYDSSEVQNIDDDTIRHYVQNFLINRIGTPKTPKEQEVYKRYYRGVYQEIMSYRQQLIKKLDQRKRQGDADARGEPLSTPKPGLKGDIKTRLGSHAKPIIPKE